MKPCPFCAEAIQDAAIKCRYCAELLEPIARSTRPWYLRSLPLVGLFLVIGPLILPMVWMRQDLSRIMKWNITLIVCLVTYTLVALLGHAVGTIGELYQLIDG